MNLLRTAALAPAALALALSIPASAATTEEREFRFAADRFELRRSGGATEVHVRGGVEDPTPGRPALPWLAETLEVPAGLRVARVEIVGADYEPLAGGVRLPSAAVMRPGIAAVERTAPDPAYFERAGFQPGMPVRLGPQGFQRGRTLAEIRLCPVRWDAATGALERATRMRVRLTFEPSPAGPLARERGALPWDAGATAGPRRGATPTALAGGLRGAAQPFAATQIPSVLGSPVEYVIVTNDAMASEFQRLADWKTQSGVPAVVRTLSFIQQEYPRGSDDAERVRDFIRDAYSRWGTKWVLLGGDTEVLPTRIARTSYYGGENIATDMYFSCLDGNWDADGDKLYGEGSFGEADPGDQVDLYPDVYVGRAPVTTPAQAQLFVDKTLQYARTPVGDYEDAVLLFAEVLFPENWEEGEPIDLDGGTLAEELLPYIDDNPAVRTVRFYQNDTSTVWRPGVRKETRQAVYDSLNRGYGVSVHIGHGYRNVMSIADGNLYNPDVMALANGDRLTALYAVNCTSNAIDFPCIGEAFLLAPNGGAVTSTGSTRFDFPYAGRHFEKEYFRLLYSDSVNAAGELQAKQKLPLIQYSDYDGAYRWMQFTLLLLGDPELRLWTGRPRHLAVSHPASLSFGDTSFTVHVETGGSPLAGARVTAYKAGDDYRSVLTDVSGNAVVPFRPDSLGPVTVTVTGYDCRPYQSTITLTTPLVPHLADQAPQIDDDALGGTSGDGDGLWDAGEVIDLRVPVRNTGGATANGVSGTLSTSDGLVTISNGSVSYGPVFVNSVVTPTGAFRLSVPTSAPDQREIALTLTLTDNASRVWVEPVRIVLRATDLRHLGHDVDDLAGNADGVPNPGETVTYLPVLKNLGTATAYGVTAVLRSLDGFATVTDSTTTWGTLEPGEEKSGDALVFSPANLAAELELRISDEHGFLYAQPLDLLYPAAPGDLTGLGSTSSIVLTWIQSGEADLLGYNVYRSTAPGGPFARVNRVPTDRIARYEDSGLPSLTRYYYQVTVVDSSGNESAPSAVASVSTNPPSHTVFPIPMSSGTFGPVVVDHLYPGYPLNIVAGSDWLYLWHPDGTAPVDADGAGTSSGDFSTRGKNFPGGASIADVDGDGQAEVIAVAQDSTQVLVFDRFGVSKPGWPRKIADGAWSSVAIGDLDNDGDKELVFGSTIQGVSAGNKLYVLRHDGSEWMDGDANPATFGVFKVLGAPYNYGTPAIADLDGNGERDIIYGAFDGKVYAWRPNGTNLPGFPIQLPGPITASVAVGYLDGPGDAQLDVVALTGSLTTHTGPDSLYAFTAAGVKRAGFPKFVRSSSSGKAPSPALADMNNDTYVDIVVASTNGRIYVYDRNGAIVAPWNAIPFSSITTGATEASPVVADIDGDGLNDVVIGDESGRFTAIGGTGTVLPGFPLQLAAEVKSAAALCDCDGDTKTEIIVAGWDKNVYMWDYDFTFSPTGPPPWPQYHHDAQRTGLLTHPVFTGAEPPPAAPRAVEFAAPRPNPSRGSTRMWYSIPADGAGSPLELAVFDLGGRQVRLLERGEARMGRRSADWDLRDHAGARVGPGIYFVRLTIGTGRLSHKFIVLE
jgi:hypothetical protein